MICSPRMTQSSAGLDLHVAVGLCAARGGEGVEVVDEYLGERAQKWRQLGRGVHTSLGSNYGAMPPTAWGGRDGAGRYVVLDDAVLGCTVRGEETSAVECGESTLYVDVPVVPVSRLPLVCGIRDRDETATISPRPATWQGYARRLPTGRGHRPRLSSVGL